MFLTGSPGPGVSSTTPARNRVFILFRISVPVVGPSSTSFRWLGMSPLLSSCLIGMNFYPCGFSSVVPLAFLVPPILLVLIPPCSYPPADCSPVFAGLASARGFLFSSEPFAEIIFHPLRLPGV